MYRKTVLTVLILVVAAITVEARDPTTYVINSVGETLSKINLKTDAVTNDILTLGSDVLSYPNQIVVRDSMAYVVNSGTDEIQIINLNTEQTVDFINTGAGTNPYWMAFLDSQFVYVTLFLDNSLAKIDYINKTVAEVDSVGKRPEGIVIHDLKAYLACTGYNPDWSLDPIGKVAVYDIPGDSLLKEITVGTNPQYLAVDDSGRVHVVCTGDYFTVFGEVYLIDTEIDEVIDDFELGGSPGTIHIGPDKVAYIPAAGFGFLPNIFTYNSLTLEVYHDVDNPIEISGNAMMAIPYQDTSLIVTGNFEDDIVEIIDSAGNNLKTYVVGDGPLHVDFNYLPGDVNGDYAIDISDIVKIISWLYLEGSEPRYPLWRANVNGDYSYDISDITFLINYLYLTREPAPRVGPTWYLEY